ncbi:hypothetical protein COY00_03880 [Candidatus Pacearchaeota archaeon CG_4_10_14_0_2_um_filter_35_33]|nr:MAG: hypothetical protein AUJ63_03985 [Candidatus Pacearchaeota archaeon CG1_02_35_32]PIY81714.1 MAG: hypothetical protein COY79_01415 [Candidatus Pacearchaeota archaeon CG_4_10_14_0_8_um_filter_35_169]PIZ79532.1 MAG: hypothetical protein COY00_03880 [Candidatus Pacearchaeota archaeon CG_4_10_14_0_2_um_filter_35_33]PJA69882.1 MAG: hypothetical protein CO155_02950 [Candidatus Pacearchaeota archaeon CG_4_9_14_3_um_filter_35_19]PJB93999.1 MAG: hypothetical protein CO081_03250 [Candidatus Pacear
MKEKTSQEKLFNHILSLTPIIEIEEKEEGLTYSGKRREYILVNRNKINFHNFKAHLDTIQKRNYLNNFCLYEISKDCDNKDNITKKEVESLDKEKNNYLPNFIIQCEYFLFSTKTIFDTIFKIIKYIFPNTRHKGFGEIEIWQSGDMMNDLISDNLDWFIEFNNLRNRLTHDTIAGISTSIQHKAKEGTITYSKRNLNVRKDDEQGRDLFQLPDYFEKCFSKTNKVIKNFYELLLKQKIEGNSIS